MQALNKNIEDALEKMGAEDWKAADGLLKDVIGSPAFEYLPVERRHALLTAASGVALVQDDLKNAHQYSVRACALPNPTVEDWQVRLYAALGMSEMPDAAVALTQITRQWPATLTKSKDDLIFRILKATKTIPEASNVRFDLLAALYDAKWKIAGLFEPSSVWRDYALALLERRLLSRAKQVSLRIEQPSVLISMRADRRFDVLTKSSPGQFDIDRAVDSQIVSLREIVRNSPRTLQNVVELTYALLKARRYEEVLTLTDEIIKAVNDHRTGTPPYDDVKETLIWVLNNRAVALGGLGRRDEELEFLIRAARRPEHGDLNVSQAINLGDYYCGLGRPHDALFAIIDVQDTSAYGETQLQAVRLCAALQLNDTDAVNKSLAYLKEHQTDSPRTYQRALVDVGDRDGAARFIIARLNDPGLRSDALVEIQNYNDMGDLPENLQSRQRYGEVLSRNDVRDALVKVGRIESFNLAPDMH